MRLNLLIDASSIFYRSLYTQGNFGKKSDEKLLESPASQGVFMRKLATDFASLIRSIENIDRVIVCADSSSWRKSVPIAGGSYKGNRSKDDDSPIDWKSFFSLIEEFLEVMSSKGYIVSKLQSAKADDLLYLWSVSSHEAGESVVIVTGDRDMHQTVKHNENGTWTIAIDPVTSRRKVRITQQSFDSVSSSESQEADIFDTSTWQSSNDKLKSILETNTYEIIDPGKISASKVIIGDGGDCVPPVFWWPSEKKLKNRDISPDTMIENFSAETCTSLGEAKVNAIVESMEIGSWTDLLDDNVLMSVISLAEKQSKQSFSFEKVKNDIRRNISLVILDKEIIPSDIVKKFEEEFPLENTPVRMHRAGILEGTRWWTDKKEIVPSSWDMLQNVPEQKGPEPLF